MKKYVLYTAEVGNYDEIIQPLIIDSDFDYILFSDDVSQDKIGIWQVRKIPYCNSDNIRVNRWVKLHPHLLLPEYEYSLYHDANVIIDSFNYYKRIKELISKGVLIASMSHHERRCIYEEAFTIMFNRLDSNNKILNEVEHLKKAGYPPNNGLNEANCILRKHNDTTIIQVNEDWWNMISTYSRRDQMSFNYAAWKNSIDINLIYPPGQNTRNSLEIHATSHKKQNKSIRHAIWIQDLREQIYSTLKPFYDDFVKAKPNSMTEKYNRLMLTIGYYYFRLKVEKYLYCTKVKKLLNKQCLFYHN